VRDGVQPFPTLASFSISLVHISLLGKNRCEHFCDLFFTNEPQPHPPTRWWCGGRAFAYAGPSNWNSLPAHHRDNNLSLSTFKRYLKTFLLSSSSTHTCNAFGVLLQNALYKSTDIIIKDIQEETAHARHRRTDGQRDRQTDGKVISIADRLLTKLARMRESR